MFSRTNASSVSISAARKETKKEKNKSEFVAVPKVIYK